MCLCDNKEFYCLYCSSDVYGTRSNPSEYLACKHFRVKTMMKFMNDGWNEWERKMCDGTKSPRIL